MNFILLFFLHISCCNLTPVESRPFKQTLSPQKDGNFILSECDSTSDKKEIEKEINFYKTKRTLAGEQKKQDHQQQQQQLKPSARKYLENILDKITLGDEEEADSLRTTEPKPPKQPEDSSEFADVFGGSSGLQLRRGECGLKTMEVSFRIANCGRIVLNTTSCSGLCKSSEHIIANTQLKKRSCSACKPYEFVDVKYKIKCLDGSISDFTLKKISACSCFKHSESILPMNRAVATF